MKLGGNAKFGLGMVAGGLLAFSLLIAWAVLSIKNDMIAESTERYNRLYSTEINQTELNRPAGGGNLTIDYFTNNDYMPEHIETKEYQNVILPVRVMVYHPQGGAIMHNMTSSDDVLPVQFTSFPIEDGNIETGFSVGYPATYELDLMTIYSNDINEVLTVKVYSNSTVLDTFEVPFDGHSFFTQVKLNLEDEVE